ncbi:amino acid adenylation domain-containing protein, partial [Pedobacter suwonensis]
RRSKFDLSLSAGEYSGGLQLSFSYSAELFSGETVSRFAAYFKHIVDQVVSDPGVLLGDISLLDAGERSGLLELGKGPVADYGVDRTVLSLFAEQVLRNPSALAIVFEDQVLSYRELDGLSNQIAHYLKARAVGKGDLAGVKLERGSWLVIAQLAVLKMGAVYVSIDPGYPDGRIDFIKEDSKCKLIIDAAFISGFQVQREAYANTGTGVPVAGNDAAYVIYTSGSTGKPKGVLVKHESLSNLCLWHQGYYGVSQSSRGTLYSSVGFDASVWEIYPYLTSGACLYPILRDEVRYNVYELQKFFLEHGITHAYLPSIICHELVKNDIPLDDTLILTGGDVLKLKGYNRLKIYNNYGPTENTVVTTVADLSDYKGGVISIGRPIAGSRVYVVDGYGGLSPMGVAGELCVSGLGLAQGYVGNDALTREKFVANPFEENSLMYRTGDLVRWGPGGNLEFLGRVDDQVKIRGYRIEPGEIEVVMGGLEGVGQVLVVARGDGGEKALVAYYTTQSGAAVPDLKERAQELLPDYMLP